MKSQRILIVEDEAITAAALKSELTDMGNEVVSMTDNAQDAVRAAGELMPDLVFMDITLKGMLDGITAATAIRGQTGIPVIFLTAHADEMTIKRAVFAGPFEYILKPFSRMELQDAIDKSLALHRKEVSARLKVVV
jgi:CheY-like chemotaxis protein